MKTVINWISLQSILGEIDDKTAARNLNELDEVSHPSFAKYQIF